MNSSNNISDSDSTSWTTSNQDGNHFTIPKLPSQFLLIARIVISCFGLSSNLIVLLICAQCRRLRHPRHTCWMAVTIAALLVLLLAVIEMLSAAYPTRSAYTFLLFFKGTPFVFFSLGYCLVAVERFLAVSHYLWHKDNVTNQVVVLAFGFVGLIVLAGLGLANILGRQAHYFMPGNGISSWKLLLLGVTVMSSSLVGIVLQVLTYRQVKQLYRAHPTLRQTDRHLFQVRYHQQQSFGTVPRAQLTVTSKEFAASNVTCAVTPTSQYATIEKSRASRLDLEAGFYYFVISLPVLISNGVTGMFLTFNYICSHTKLADDCHRWIAILLYIRTIQLFITACNPIIYFTLSSEFRSACRSKFGTTRFTKT